MANISTSDLIEKFRYALNNKWGYIWGAAGELWTETKQKNATREQTVKYGSRWIGHYVADCSGLFSWAFKQLGGSIYHGSDTMYRKYTTDKGSLVKGKRTDGKELKPGTGVFVWKEADGKYGHVGLYVGGDTVIEAAGTKEGVITSKVSNKKWTNWGELKGVDYGDAPKPVPVPEGKAIVTGKNVALREGPGTDTRVMIRIATGTLVNLAKIEGWTYVKYGTKTGFMMNEYIEISENSIKVTGKNVALRAGTGTATRVLTRIPTGTTVPRDTIPDGWTYVEHDGRKGFMMEQYIKEG